MLNCTNGPVGVRAFELEPEAGGGLAILLASTDFARDDRSEQIVLSVRGALDSVGSISGDPTNQTVEEFDQSDDHNERRTYREIMVSIVAMSLSIWIEAKGGSKFDLAGQSGIWRVNLDRSSLQTRTLDKYMLIDTLPTSPCWRDVIRTGE